MDRDRSHSMQEHTGKLIVSVSLTLLAWVDKLLIYITFWKCMM